MRTLIDAVQLAAIGLLAWRAGVWLADWEQRRK